MTVLGKYAKLLCHFALKYIDGSSAIYQNTKLTFHWTYKQLGVCMVKGCWIRSVFRKDTLMGKKILHLWVISLLTKCEQSVQRTGLTMKVERRALHLSCGFQPCKIIILHARRNAYYSCPGTAGLTGIAVLMAVPRLPPGILPCSTHQGWGAVPLHPLPPGLQHIRSQP